ncbi:hypothetical protein B0H66DRAFT_533680 [Apodospora peruviana]|uniref:Uncharacterized protein n=1 Tax=Apodospora peruviana TaxID=516989 RepID=A0AAE0I664_9PEZI|nr:hypothetical protein B0H66DRAFT_533680 [Apodospora peruviana]
MACTTLTFPKVPESTKKRAMESVFLNFQPWSPSQETRDWRFSVNLGFDVSCHHKLALLGCIDAVKEKARLPVPDNNFVGCVHELLIQCEDFKAAYFLAHTRNPGMSIRVQETMVMLAAAYLIQKADRMASVEAADYPGDRQKQKTGWLKKTCVSLFHGTAKHQAKKGGLWFLLGVYSIWEREDMLANKRF